MNKWVERRSRELVDDQGRVLGRVVREARGGWRVYVGEDTYGTNVYMSEAMDCVACIVRIKQQPDKGRGYVAAIAEQLARDEELQATFA